MGVFELAIIIYVLIGLYAILTGTAGMLQWKEIGFQVRSLLFVVMSISMLILLFISNKNSMFIMLIVVFIIIHLLSLAEGMLTKKQLTYSHHIFRFTFHVILLMLVYNFIL